MHKYPSASVALFVKAGLVTSISLLFLWACDSSPEYARFEGATQGTSYHITAQLPKGVSRTDVQAVITQRLEDIDKSLSSYRPDSEISQFNRLAVDDGLMVSSEFIEVLDISREVYRASGKLFDPSVKELLDLWGFGAKTSSGNDQVIPDETQIRMAKATMYFDNVANHGRQLKKLAPVSIDLNGVAQGYTVDVLKRELLARGVQNYMIEVGGELATKGLSPRGTSWRIGVEKPERLHSPDGNVFAALLLQEAYVSTSGDYRNYHEINGKRYSHTIDPRTGRPVLHRLASVTVLSRSTGHADAWSTALMVLGEEEGFALAEKLQMPAYFIYRDGDRFAVKSTSAMQAYIER